MADKNNVLQDIRSFIFPGENDYLWIRGEHKKLIENFIENPVLETARELYNYIQRSHKKESVFTFMEDLQLYEKTLMKIIPEQRDHYLHSASVYLLGLSIYNSHFLIRNAVNTDRNLGDEDKQNSSFLFRWSLTACLHDIAYPLELTLKSFNKYSNKLHEIDQNNFSFIKINRTLYDRFNLLPIIKPNEKIDFKKNDTALGLIANRIVNNGKKGTRISYDTLLRILDKDLETNLMNGRIDHGAFSAILILNRIHKLYEKNDWNTEDYYTDVVDAATAVFLHNAYRFSSLKELFGDGIYKYDSPSPLGYLLFICDSLCEWLRGRKRDSHHYSVMINNNGIKYVAPKKVKKILDKAKELFDERIKIEIIYKD